MILRPARSGEAAALSELALRSKGHWGYGRAFLDACREELTVHEPELAARRVVVAEQDGVPAGFCTLDGDPPDGTLGFLFVEPVWIGRGVGRLLWDDLTRRATELGFRTLAIEADPSAEPFYLAMGAVRTGTVPSGTVEGRLLPLLTMTVPTHREAHRDR